MVGTALPIQCHASLPLQHENPGLIYSDDVPNSILHFKASIATRCSQKTKPWLTKYRGNHCVGLLKRLLKTKTDS